MLSSISPLPKFSPTSSATPPRPTTFRPPGTTTDYKERPSSLFSLSSERNMASSSSSLYEVLRIPVGASSQQIKSAYRRLARTCHPDVAALDRKPTSADEFMEIHTAYSTLSDPAKRALYDLNLVRNNRPLTVGYSGDYRGRNWETDQCW